MGWDCQSSGRKVTGFVSIIAGIRVMAQLSVAREKFKHSASAIK